MKTRKSLEKHMKPIYFLPFFSLLILVSSGANAVGSMLRVTCEGSSSGAEILVDGHLKGECPVDIQILPGTVKLRAQKAARQGRELYFEQEIKIGEGVVKKIEINLGQSASPSFSDVQSSANSGDAIAMMGLAWRYKRGMQVPQDDKQSLLWYRKAAAAFKKAADDKADTKAMMGLGDLYFQGNGVRQSDQQGASWYLKAANGGNGQAMLSIGDRISAGKGFEKSDEQAKIWYEKAVAELAKKAASGDGEAMITLGGFYSFGGGQEKVNSEQEAVNWWRKAAEAGNLTGMLLFAQALEFGTGGIQKDLEQALVWMKKAAAGGEEQAIDYLSKRKR